MMIITKIDKKRPRTITGIKMPHNLLKRKVIGFMKARDVTDIAEIHQALECDFLDLVKVMDELRAEGKIGDA